jgi:hypothetical protein
MLRIIDTTPFFLSDLPMILRTNRRIAIQATNEMITAARQRYGLGESIQLINASILFPHLK